MSHKVAIPVRVKSKPHMQVQFEHVMKRGGQGIILRKPASKYLQPESFFQYKVQKI